MSDVPTEILVNILSRLPVKSLLKFRCVSNPWRTLIDSPYFVRFQLNQSIETNTNLNIILGGDSCLYSVGFDSLKNAIELDNPLKCDEYGTVVLGSCNGLLCLSTTVSDNEIALWNPSTRKCKKILLMPVCFELGSSRRFCIEGFGYDHVNDDYNVVRLVQSCDRDSHLCDSEVKVYSLKSNSWRRVQDFPYYLCYQPSYSAFASGSLHWIVSQKPEPDIDYLIAAFDLGTEEYRLVPQPEYSDKNFDINLAVLGGCLCVLCNHHRIHVDIWVMKNYGVKESWTKLISIAHPANSISLAYVTPTAYSKSGREVLLEQDNEKLIWYDIENKKYVKTRILGMPDRFVADVYLESLVQLNTCLWK